MLMRRYVLISLLSLLGAACSDRPTHRADGYIEGDYTYIATSVSGALKELMVEKGQTVKQGDPLFVLEEQPESDVYEASAENLKQAIKASDSILANLEFARLTYERYKVLVPKKAIQQSQLDNAHAVYDATVADLAKSKASIAEAQATLAEAKWRKDQKRMAAPVDGFIFDTYYRIGEYTEANKPVLAMLAPQDVKVIFYVNAKDLGALRLNDDITVKCSECEKDYIGKITYISAEAEYTPPVIYSTETSDKLVFRIEGHFNPTDAIKLHPGMPATVMYHDHGK